MECKIKMHIFNVQDYSCLLPHEKRMLLHQTLLPSNALEEMPRITKDHDSLNQLFYSLLLSTSITVNQYSLI